MMVDTKTHHITICGTVVPRGGASRSRLETRAKRPTARSVGTSVSKRSRKRSSAYLARSGTIFRSVGKFEREVIHPMWLHRKPCCCGEWTSSDRSERRWWCRWWAAHQRGPRWEEE